MRRIARAATLALPLALALLARAQPAPAETRCQLAELLTIPVTMDGRKPDIKASIDGNEVEFTLDSGAFFSVMTSEAADRFALRRRSLPFGYAAYGIGGLSDEEDWVTVDQLVLAGVPLSKVPFIVNDDLAGGRISGVLGQSVLSGFDIDYDLANGVIHLLHPVKGCMRASLADYWRSDKPYTTIDIEPMDLRVRHTMGTVEVNGHRLTAVFDTGAASSMVDLRSAERAGFRADAPGVTKGGDTAGFGPGRVQTWIAPFDSFKIGEESVLHTRLRVGDMKHVHTEMLVGADFFLSHRVYVSNLQRKMYIEYLGGPVFDLSNAREVFKGADAARDELPDADAYGRRGAAAAARGDLEGALSDFTRACEMAPAEARYPSLRADVYVKLGEREAARKDLDRALDLDPAASEVRIKRAVLELFERQVDAAVADLQAAAGSERRGSRLQLPIADLLGDAGRPELALPAYDGWIDSHPNDRKLARVLNNRCWSAALANRELDAARLDCDRALKLEKGAAWILDSRGLVELRQGRYDEAIEDYDAALKKRPDQAWSLYGRGLARLKKGKLAEGQADIDAAMATDPKIIEESAKYGIGP